MNCDEKAALMDLVKAAGNIIKAAVNEKQLGLRQLQNLAKAYEFGAYQLKNENKIIGFAAGV